MIKILEAEVMSDERKNDKQKAFQLAALRLFSAYPLDQIERVLQRL